MAEYRTKSKAVQAVQVTRYFLQMGGESLLPQWVQSNVRFQMTGSFGADQWLKVSSGIGTWAAAKAGDWIVKNEGVVLVLCDEEFRERYEPLTPPASIAAEKGE